MGTLARNVRLTMLVFPQVFLTAVTLVICQGIAFTCLLSKKQEEAFLFSAP